MEYLPLMISGICALLLIMLITALIFRSEFRDAVLGGTGEAKVLGILSVKGVAIVLLCGLFLAGLIYPLQYVKDLAKPKNSVEHSVNVPTPSNTETTDLELKLIQGIRNYFQSQDWISPDPGIVMGLSKGIVRRFETDSDPFGSVRAEIETHKREDNNWTYANRLQSALALVHALGLSPKSTNRNETFLSMVLPSISPKETPKN